MMKKTFWMIAAALSLTLAACGSPPPTNAAPTPSEVATSAPSISSPDVVIASAESLPAQETHISFVISAPVKEILVKEGDTVTAGQTLMTVYAPDLEGNLAQAEFTEKSTALEYQYWIPPRLNRPPERKQQAKAEWEQTIMAVEVARAALLQSFITAPFDAAVIEVKVKPGEYAQTGQAVIVLADTARMQIVTTDLSERDVARIKAGQTASIYLEALDQTVTGKVLRISPVSKIVGGDVVFPVTIELDEQIAGLLWGMSAEVEIQTE